MRIHDGEEETRHRVLSALWNAGILAVAIVTVAVVLFGVLAFRAS
jgi:hypothetical protein